MAKLKTVFSTNDSGAIGYLATKKLDVLPYKPHTLYKNELKIVNNSRGRKRKKKKKS